MSTTLTRVGAAAAVLSGFVFVSYELLNFVLGYPETGAGDHLTSSLKAVGLLALTLGAVGLYLHQAERMGRVGMGGFLAAFTGSVLVTGIQLSDVWLGQPIEQAAPEIFETPSTSMLIGLFGSYVVFLVGWLVFAAATSHTGLFPAWAGRAFLATSVLALAAIVGLPGPSIPFHLVLAWLGWEVLRRTRAHPAGERAVALHVG